MYIIYRGEEIVCRIIKIIGRHKRSRVRFRCSFFRPIVPTYDEIVSVCYCSSDNTPNTRVCGNTATQFHPLPTNEYRTGPLHAPRDSNVQFYHDPKWPSGRNVDGQGERVSSRRRRGRVLQGLRSIHYVM